MFVIEKHRGNPDYLQIQSQLERLIASGSLAPGGTLPSVRTLAAQLRINPNTVVRAYRELEILGLVETRHGEGSFVTADAADLARASALIEKRAHDYVRDARQLGLKQTEAIAAIKAAWRRIEVAEASPDPTHAPPRPRAALAHSPPRATPACRPRSARAPRDR